MSMERQATEIPTPVNTGVVVIGRNEGLRLKHCLESIVAESLPVVYVDSGSTDDSVELAESLNCDVVHLDMNRPFTAGRARNSGFEFLLRAHPQLEYVQFIDGDCILQPGWVAGARERLSRDPGLAIVCGRRRERFPHESVYNTLCDMEWDSPVGEASACGGDFLVRVSAFRQVSGFDPAVIAGEEPEMCFRLRRHGWRIDRLAAEMTLHDAAMHRFSQFWKRARRSGHAFAQGAMLHRQDSERFQQRELLSIAFWTLVPLLTALLTAPVFPAVAPAPLLAYPALWLKILRNRLGSGQTMRQALIYASFISVGKFAQLGGVLDYLRRKLERRQFEIIEYK